MKNGLPPLEKTLDERKNICSLKTSVSRYDDWVDGVILAPEDPV